MFTETGSRCTWMVRVSVCAAAACAILAGSPSTSGQEVRSLESLAKRTRSERKLSSHLAAVWAAARQGRDVAAVLRDDFVLSRATRNGAFRVDVRLTVRAGAAELTALRGAGLKVQAASGGLVCGTIAPASLKALADLPQVSTVHPDYGCRTRNAGAVANQADDSLRAGVARSLFGVDGTGVKVGVLSDSFHDTIGGTVSGGFLTGSSPQLSGDLPGQVQILDNGPGANTDEGAGMAELIYDLAPGCDLAFHSAFNNLADFASGITELRTVAGCDVIVDDVIYFAEPMFQDGEIAQAAQGVVDAGVPYFSSAGNNTDEGTPPTVFNGIVEDGETVHAWAPGDPFLDVTFGPGSGQIIVVLQWNQPYSGTLGPGSSVDLDLYLIDRTTGNWTTQIRTGSAGFQGTPGSPAGDPLEIFSFSASGGTDHILIHDFNDGAAGTVFRMVVFASGNVTFQPGTLGGMTIYGHNSASGAMAVAAVFYGEIDSGGTLVSPSSTINVESFSSLGGDLPFYFDPTGAPLPGAPVHRFKPEIASADGTNTTFFGSDISFDADGFPNFFGTSAAAPHAAALAALAIELRAGGSPALTPDELYTAMKDSALDIESPGVDTLSGSGLVLGDTLLAALTCNDPTFDVDGDGTVGGGDFGVFGICFNGALPPGPGCECMDVDGDGDVDGGDFGVFAACYSGGAPADPACDDL